MTKSYRIRRDLARFACAVALSIGWGPFHTPDTEAAETDGEEVVTFQDLDRERAWISRYYLDPTPHAIGGKISQWSRFGILSHISSRSMFVGFLSQVFAQNPERLAAWHADWRSLPPEDRQTLRLALRFSHVPQATEIIKAEDGSHYAEMETPKILDLPLSQLPSFDMVCGYFHATGSQNALRRIVSCFRYEELQGRRPDNVPQGFIPYYETLPERAHTWILTVASEQPGVRLALRQFLGTGQLAEPEKRHVQQIVTAADRGPEGQ